MEQVGGLVAAGLCTGCGFVNATLAQVNRITCGGCGEQVRLTYVRGSYNGAVPCNADCQYAYGPVCSCSCGGDNHRRGYIAERLVPVWVRERDRKRHEEKVARAAEKERKLRLSREEQAQARRAGLLQRVPGLAALADERYADPTGNSFLYDMHYAFQRGDMTDRQAEAAERAVARDQQRRAERQAREAQDVQLRAAGVSVPYGTHTFTGRIVSVRQEPNPFNPRGATVWRGLIDSGQGWRVWGTLPKGLEPPKPAEDATQAEAEAVWDQWVGWRDRLPGRVITVRAQLKPSTNDPLFGYFSRPRLVDAHPDVEVFEAERVEPAEPGRERVLVPAARERVAAPERFAQPWAALLSM